VRELLPNQVVVDPEAQGKEAEHNARLFFLIHITIGDFCASKVSAQ
jgi:hypothetical protein